MTKIHLRIIAFILLIGIWGSAVHAQDQPNFYAVIIGVSQFAHLAPADQLEFADADAHDFYNFITSPRGRSFPPENVFLLTYEAATFQAIRSRLGSTLAKKVKSGDTVYIFIATHGMVEKEAAKEAYLLGSDSDREDLYSSALPMRELGDIMQNRLKNAGRVFLFADACRSGKLGQVQGSINRYIEDVSKRGETMGLLASRPNEFSREGKQFGNGHGAFTYYLLKGLMGEADADGDKVVTAAELISYLQSHVETATEKQQHVRDFGDFEASTPVSFVDKPGPKDWTLTALPRQAGTEIASLRAAGVESVADGVATRSALEQALREGRLLAPAGNNAWEDYQHYTQLPVPAPEKEAAKDDLEIALASAGEKVLWAYRRGDQVIRLDAAKYGEGAQLFTRASQIDPDDKTLESKAKFLSGRQLVENRRYPEGISLLREAIRLDPEAAFSYNALGIAYMEQQRWNEAIENFRAASTRAEKWVYPHYNLARVYTGQKRYREAEQEFKKGIEIGNELGLKYSYLNYNLGILYLFQNNNSEAERQFRLAIEMKPDDAMSYHNLGLVSERKGDSGQAASNFQKAAELDPKLIEPRLKLAEIYGEQKRDDLRDRMLQEAVTAAADPRSAASMEPLGKLLLEDRKLEEAEKVFVQMLTSGGNTLEALTGLGDVHSAQGRWADAADDYRQALTRTNDQKVQRDLDKKLKAAEKKK